MNVVEAMADGDAEEPHEHNVMITLWTPGQPTPDPERLAPRQPPAVLRLLQGLCSGSAPKNRAEGTFHRMMTKRGWKLTKKGWPYFFMVKDNRKIALVECKPARSRRLKKHQHMVMYVLASFGVPCYRWSPDDGFIRIGVQEPEPADVPGLVQNVVTE